MPQPVNYVEINSPDLAKSAAFFEAVFAWTLQPFAAPDYLVAAAGDTPGVDTGLLTSRDGQPRTGPVIRVEDLDTAAEAVLAHGGAVVVAPFVIGGVGRGCYITDPTGVLVGLHDYDPDAA
jgi:uncharacterized protein